MDDPGTGGHQSDLCDQGPINVWLPPSELPRGEHGRAVSRKYSAVVGFFFSAIFGVFAVQMLSEGDGAGFVLVALVAIGMFAFGRTLWDYDGRTSQKPTRAKSPSRRGRKK